MTEALKLEPRYTYQDYIEWEDRYELIDGIAYAMAPAPMPIHQKILFSVAKILDKNLSCSECEVYISPIDWKISDDTVIQPDIAIFCQEPNDRYFTKTPYVVVEVLSPATAHKDTTVKLKLYERVGVKYYILIEPNELKFEVLELIDKEYQPLEQKDIYKFSWDRCYTAIDFRELKAKR